MLGVCEVVVLGMDLVAVRANVRKFAFAGRSTGIAEYQIRSTVVLLLCTQ